MLIPDMPSPPTQRTQYRQLQRALRLKHDLQEVAVSREYRDMLFDLEEGAADVSLLVMDEVFWSEVINILKVTVPIIKLLRACDNQAKEVIGKVYHCDFMMALKKAYA